MDSLASPTAAALFGKSLLIGLAIAAPVGQIGLLAIQRTLAHGRAAGLATGMGAALADAVYGAVGAFGVQALMAWLLGLASWLSLFGGLFLLVLAWRTATRPAPTTAAADAKPTTRSTTLLACTASTFVLTLANPTTLLSFAALFGALAGSAPSASPWAMVAGVLVGSALWWLVLATAVGALRHRFDARRQRLVNQISAALLAGIGLWQLTRWAS